VRRGLSGTLKGRSPRRSGYTEPWPEVNRLSTGMIVSVPKGRASALDMGPKITTQGAVHNDFVLEVIGRVFVLWNQGSKEYRHVEVDADLGKVVSETDRGEPIMKCEWQVLTPISARSGFELMS
jgi:hypothetical protein